MKRLCPLVLSVPLLLLPTGSSASNPWNLHCPSAPYEKRVPPAVRPAAHRFFPWAGPNAEEALQSGPLYLLALSTGTAISRDGDGRDGAGYYLHRALVAVAPPYRGQVVLTGRRLGRTARRTVVDFATNGATRCSVSGAIVSCMPRRLAFAPSLRIAPRSGWRIVRTELRIGRTGCFRVAARGAGLHTALPLMVPGPDWGTPGW